MRCPRVMYVFEASRWCGCLTEVGMLEFMFNSYTPRAPISKGVGVRNKNALLLIPEKFATLSGRTLFPWPSMLSGPT